MGVGPFHNMGRWVTTCSQWVSFAKNFYAGNILDSNLCGATLAEPASPTLIYNRSERYPPMQCPVCNAFKRELSQECEHEAVATLRQRANLAAPVSGQSFQDLESEILLSRKRRAHIATELHEHTQDVHPEDSDSSLGIGKVASA